MDNNNVKVCRLCLEVISNLNCETLDDVKLAMLKVLPLNLNPAYTTDALICSQCTNNLQRIFSFKTACLDNNDYLKTFLHYGSNFTLVLEEVIVRESSTQNEIKHENEKVCRLCLKYFDIELFTKLDQVEDDIFLKHMLEKCLPELDLNVPKTPLMCPECMYMLQMQFNFVISCLEVDERIQNFEMSVAANCGQHDLSNVLKIDSIDPTHLTLEKESDNDTKYISELVVKKEEVFTDIDEPEFHDKESLKLNVKAEETTIGGCINTEEDIKPDLDAEETLSDNDACQSEQHILPKPETLKRNANGMFVCTLCSYNTNRRDSMVIHFSSHTQNSGLSEFDPFKCNECSFVTKWSSSLRTHVLLHKNPTEVELFYCAKCSYKSMHKKHIRRHCKTHMKSKPISTSDMYECQHCSFTTKRKAYLKKHSQFKHKRNVVLPEKFVKCEECNYQSRVERSILIHMRIAHNIVKENKPVKKYACELCDYNTYRMSCLKEHSLKHKSCNEVEMFNCAKCSFQTKYRNNLRLHLKRHKPDWQP